MIIDFSEERKRRQRYAVLDSLMTEAHQHLRNLGLSATGVLVVLKTPRDDGGATLSYREEGITRDELRTLFKSFTGD